MLDVIDHLAGHPPPALRREEARRQAQASFDALFAPVDAAGFSLAERWAVAAFVAALHNQPESKRFYAERLLSADQSLGEAVALAASRAAQAAPSGPVGSYPAGPLSAEDRPAPPYRTDPAGLGAKLAAAFDHAHMLLFHPRDAAPAHMRPLVAAGWTTPAIVTLSQLVAFLSFQIRVAAGLRAMAAAA